MDDRKILLSLIKQNSEKINGIVASNSNSKNLENNEKIVNNAINFCFCADSDCYYVKDYRHKVDNLSLLRLFVLQNDVMDKLFSVKQIDFKFFLKDCKNMIDDFRESEKYNNYFSGKFEYKHLVPTRKEFLFSVHSAPLIKPVTKAESSKITAKEKFDTLLAVTKKAYNIYQRQVDNINILDVSFEEFVTNLNFGDLSLSFREYLNKQGIVVEVKNADKNLFTFYSKDDTLEREKQVKEIKKITNKTKIKVNAEEKLNNIINSKNKQKEKRKMEIEIIDLDTQEPVNCEEKEELQKDEYYFDEGGQGYLFTE